MPSYHYNPQTGQLEDENGNPQPAVAIDQMGQGQGNPLGDLAANQRAGIDLSQPVSVIPPGESLPPRIPPGLDNQVLPPMPAATPVPPEKPATLSQTTVTREKPTKAEGEALGKVQQDFTNSAATARQEGDLLGRAATFKAGGEAENLIAAQKRESQLASEQEKRNAAVAEAQAKVEADRQKYEVERQKLAGMDIKDMYEGHPGMLIGKAIALALGAFGAGLAHTGNGAAEVISANEQTWYNLQRSKIEKQKEAVGEAKQAIGLSQGEVTAARQSKSDALSDLTLKAAARADTVAAQVRSQIAGLGTEDAKLQAEKIAQQQEQLRDGYFLKYQEGLRAKISTTSETRSGGPGAAGKVPTESEAKMAFLAQQMRGELDTIQKNPGLAESVLSKMQSRGITSEAADTTAAKGIMGAAGVGLGRAVGVIPKSKYEGMTGKEQLVANAWDNLTEKYARVLTGAGMPEGEARRLALQDAPHGGDSPVVIAQKFQRMKSAADQFMSLAPRGAAIVAPAAPGGGGGPAPRANAAPVSADDQAAVAWAKSHPNDPRARQILSMHGM